MRFFITQTSLTVQRVASFTSLLYKTGHFGGLNKRLLEDKHTEHTAISKKLLEQKAQLCSRDKHACFGNALAI